MSKDFDQPEIIELYREKVKRPASYFESLPATLPCPVPGFERTWVVGDYSRVRIVLDFQKWIQKYSLERPNCLGVTSQTEPELYFLNPVHIEYLPYPPVDLHALDEHCNDFFDMFIFNQTLEHLYNPFKAVQSIFKALKSGGTVFTSVPTLSIPHLIPIHFAGFTPMGLAMLFATNGFEILEIGQWGCQKYIEEQYKRLDFISADILEKVYEGGLIPNEEPYCVQCWILARKP
jgi:SAM-dependent methyltransferase